VSQPLHERSEPGGVRIVNHDPGNARGRQALHVYQVLVDGGEHDRIVRDMREARPGAAAHLCGVNLHPRAANSADSGLCRSDHASRELASLTLRPQLSANPQSVWVRQPD